MSLESNCTVSVDGDSVTISGLETRDQDIQAYLSEIDEAQRPERVETALRIGVLALRSTETVEDVDYVEKRFEALQQRLDRRVEELIGEDGELREYVDDHFGEDGRLVNEALDPSSDDSPIGQLRSDIQGMVQELRTDLEVAEKEAEMVESTRLKGEEFEDELEQKLSGVAAVTGDRLERTGEKPGQLGDSKKGDFVLDLGDTAGRIAIEAKNTRYSQPKIESEMEEVIENRGADYGLFVARDASCVPNSVGRFNEYDGSHLVVVLGDEDDDGELSGELLRVGYKWARMRVIESQLDSNDHLDASVVKEEVEAAERALKSFRTIRSKCKKIENGVSDIRDELDETQDEFEKRLDNVLEEVEKPSASDGR